MVNTILPKRVNHIVAKGDHPVWPKGSKSRGFSKVRKDDEIVGRFNASDNGVIGISLHEGHNMTGEEIKKVLNQFIDDLSL